MDRKQTNRSAGAAQPGLYLVLTLTFTWVFELSAAGFHEQIPAWGVTALHYLGGLMPLAVALILLFIKHDQQYRIGFWQRIVDPGRIPALWYGVIFLYYPLKSLLAAGLDVLLGGQGISLEAVLDLMDDPVLIFPTLVFWLLFGPVPEEPGWRGYALDGLLVRYSGLKASLIVGAVWSIWHLPLFLIPGTWQAEQVGLATPRFWIYTLSLIFDAILYTWVYQNTGRSILAVIILHFSVNAFGELFELTFRSEVVNFGLLILTAAGLAAWGLDRGQSVPSLEES